MKKITVLLLSAVLLITACKESKDKEPAEKETLEQGLAKHYMEVYTEAMGLRDLSSAASALTSYFVVVGDSTRDSSPYLDTLILLYQETRQFTPVYFLSDEQLKNNPNDTDMLILNTGIAQMVGGLSQVTDRCKQLMGMFPSDPLYKFNYAQSLIENRKIKEGETILLEIANDPILGKQDIPITGYDDNGQPVQNKVNVEIGAYMKLGQLYEILKDKRQAEKYYRKALAVDFKYKPASLAILSLGN